MTAHHQRQAWRALLLLATLLPCLAFAQAVGPAPAQPQLPDPAQLAPDWFNYFVVGTDAGTLLKERIARFTALLDTVVANVDAATRPQAQELQANIIRHLGRFERMQALMPPGTQILDPPADSYALEDVLGLARALSLRRQAYDLEGREIQLIEKALTMGETQQDATILAYRALEPAAATRVLEGLRVIRNRLRIETLAQDLRWRRQQEGIFRDDVTALTALFDVAAGRIASSPERVLFWDSEVQRTAVELETERADLMRLQLTNSVAMAVTPVERAKDRRQETRTMRRETVAALAEVRHAIAVLGHALLVRVAADNALPPEPDRQLLGEQDLVLETNAGLIPVMREALRRSRDAISIDAAENTATDITATYTRARTDIVDTEGFLDELGAELQTASELARLLDMRLAAREGRLGQSLRMLRTTALVAWNSTIELLSRSLFQINETPVTALGLLRLILIVTIALWISRLLRRGMDRLGRRQRGFTPASLYAAGRVFHYLLLTLGVVVGLSSIGVDLTKFALFASALGVGVGFGLQTLISNFVAGLIILFEKSLNVGDFIELESGITGEVKEINMRSTRITTNDNLDILIPNSEFTGKRLINWTLRDLDRRAHVPFTVAPSCDKDAVRTAALEAATSIKHTLTGVKGREPEVWLVGVSAASLQFELVVWLAHEGVNRPAAVNAAYCWAIDDALHRHGIARPAPPA